MAALKTFKQILDEMVATVKAGYKRRIDINVGSLVRSILEAASLQDAGQHVQINQAREMFSILTATGEELRRRALDYDVEEISPQKSVGINALTFGDTVAAPRAIDHPIPSGTMLVAPATASHDQLVFETTEDAVLLLGANTVIVSGRSIGTGMVQNVGTNEITEFSSKPWATATVSNTSAFIGGTDQQTDDDVRTAVLDKIRSYYGTNSPALETAARGVKLDTGQKVVSAQVLEPAALGDPAYLYIDDGAGSSPTTTASNAALTTATGDTLYGFTVLKLRAAAGEQRFRLGVFPTVVNTVRLFKSVAVGTINAYDAGTRVLTCSGTFVPGNLVGYYILDDTGRLYRITANGANTLTHAALAGGAVAPNFPGAYSILNFGLTPFVLNTDYKYNETSGEGELTNPMYAGDTLYVASTTNGLTPAFIYYTGLLREVQRVINGDKTDLATYPGVKASGVKVIVQFSTIDIFTIILSVQAVEGVDESSLYPDIRTAVVAAVNSLGVGETLTLSSIIAAAKGVKGVFDVQVNSPVSNQIMVAGHLARTDTAHVTLN